MTKKLKGISGFYDGVTLEKFNEEYNSTSVIITEAFLRACRETLDSGGIDQYQMDRIKGMLDLLEQYTKIKEELWEDED